MSPESSYSKGLSYRKQGMSCFDFVLGRHRTTSVMPSLPSVCFKIVGGISLLHLKMHVPSPSVMEKQISVKCFNV